jgi:hypothetical protein
MNTDKYLRMVDSQLQEAKEVVELTEKAFKEAKAKYDGILSFKESYIEWVKTK